MLHLETFEPRLRRDTHTSVPELVSRHGVSVSSALLDPSCAVFRAAGVNGVIGYRASFGCAVALGDPVCAPEDVPALAGAFRDHCRERGWRTAYAVATRAFKDHAVENGFAAVEFGQELILDPQRDAQAGSAGRELRKKVKKAKAEGLVVTEYKRAARFEPELEAAIESVSSTWLAARKGPQIFLASVRLFSDAEGKRFFYAKRDGQIVGLLTTLRLDKFDGYLLDHLMATPEAPAGTTETLVVEALAAMKREGCTYATFGAAPANELGEVVNLSAFSEKVARSIFSTMGNVFHLDARTRYRKKFQVAATEPAYLLFDPPQIGLREAVAMSKAFNVSLAL